MREIVLDTETTGLDQQNDKIIEIACIELKNCVQTGNIFQKYINPEKEISDDAVKIHGLTNDFLIKKPLFKEIIKDFLNFIKKDPLIIHNAEFDLGFINNELKKNNEEPVKNKIIDTLTMAREKYPGSPANLDALCRRFNIDLSSRNKHGALIDAKLTSKVYLEFKGGQQPNFNLDIKKEMKTTEDNINQYEKKKWEERIYDLKDREIENHKKLLKKIKNPIWNSYD